jgi:hypothetical protein
VVVAVVTWRKLEALMEIRQMQRLILLQRLFRPKRL